MRTIRPLPRRQIVICGNGASAAVLIHALARSLREPTTVTVIGEGRHLGEGIAYATRHSWHLLNVPAGRMSVEPDAPDQFLQWLARRGIVPQDWDSQFQPRQLYGQYLRDTLAAAICANPNLDLEIIRSEIIGLVRRQTGWTISFRTGAIHADLAVLATGNDMPAPVGFRHGPEIAASIMDNPWAPLKTRRGDDILVLGTALTAVDAVLTLMAHGHRGHITLLSRRGLLPHVHVPASVAAPLTPPWPRTTHGLLRAMRLALGPTPRAEDWQGFMDAMRPFWPEIWNGLAVVEKRRFLRHGAAIWNVHRHRLAPGAGARIDAARGDRVTILRGRIAAIARNEDGSLAVEIAGRDGQRWLDVDRIINCSGPNSDPEKTHDRLTENIIASRYARASAAGVGLDVDEACRVINREGEAQRSLFAIGAPTRGRWWEITAMPEIAQQARRLAATMIEQLDILGKAEATRPAADQLSAAP